MGPKELFQVVTEKLRGNEQIVSPELEARWIVERALGNNLSQIYQSPTDPIDASSIIFIDEATERRLSGTPLAYVLGEKEFFGLNFMVNPNVLIPRPETELIVELGLEWSKNAAANESIRILDLGTGSGCIGLSLLKLKSNAILCAVDISVEALDVADFNSKSLGVHERVSLLSLDAAAFGPGDLPESFAGKADLIVANPPYIASSDPDVDPWVKEYEPALALYSDEDGLGHIRRWISILPKLLSSNGLALFEIGHLQASEVLEMTTQLGAGLICKSHKDLSGKDRVISIEREK